MRARSRRSAACLVWHAWRCRCAGNGLGLFATGVREYLVERFLPVCRGGGGLESSLGGRYGVIGHAQPCMGRTACDAWRAGCPFLFLVKGCWPERHVAVAGARLASGFSARGGESVSIACICAFALCMRDAVSACTIALQSGKKLMAFFSCFLLGTAP